MAHPHSLGCWLGSDTDWCERITITAIHLPFLNAVMPCLFAAVQGFDLKTNDSGNPIVCGHLLNMP